MWHPDDRSAAARSLQFVCIWLVVVALVGCSSPERPGDASGDSGVDTGGRDTVEVDAETKYDIDDGSESIEELTTVPNPSNALSYYVEWSTAEPAATDLTVRCGDDWEKTYHEDGQRTDHEVFVMGLWSGADCKMTATVTDESGEPSSESVAVDVGALPDFLPDLEVHAREESSIRTGWTMFNLTNPFDDVPLTVAMVDTRGRYRWYHQLPTSNPGADTEVHPTDDSIFVGGNRGKMAPYEIDWEGNTLWTTNFPMHHEIRPAGDDSGDLLVLRHVDTCQQEVRSDGVYRYSRDRGSFVGDWVLCDYWFPPPDSDPGNDWSHINAIEPVPGEDAWILSSRTQHSLFKLDYADEDVDWVMGYRGDFGLEGEELFFRQHAPEIQENGNILLFDNGSRPNNHDRPWSRALEISYDGDSMEAEIAWQYRPDPDIFAPIWGDADRLDNGNTLSTFGLRNENPDRNSHLIEVTADKEKVWHLEAPVKWGWYRSDRLPDPPAGYVMAAE